MSESSDGICCLDFHKFHQMESCAQSVLDGAKGAQRGIELSSASAVFFVDFVSFTATALTPAASALTLSSVAFAAP